MRTCLALWNNYLLEVLHRDKFTDSFNVIECLINNEIIAFFDGSYQSAPFKSGNKYDISRDIAVIDYEELLKEAIDQTRLLPAHLRNKLPVKDYQLDILEKLWFRHHTISLDHQTFKLVLQIMYDKYLSLLQINRIQRIVFSEYPHTVYDYLFLLVSINLGIRCESVQPLGQLGRSHSFVIDMNNRCILPRKPDNTLTNATEDNFISKYSDSLNNYSIDVQNIYARNLAQTRNEYRSFLREGDVNFVKWTCKISASLREYNLLSLEPFEIPKTPFGVFYLQVEPESTVTPMSDFFSNQAFAVQDFYNICKVNNIRPCIKEHPHQYRGLYPYTCNRHWQSHKHITAAKKPNFYLDLSKQLPDLVFIPLSMPPLELITRSEYKLTGTLNGTVGLQSITLSKPVIEYGLAWYSYHPLVETRRYDSSSQSIESHIYLNNPVIETMGIDNPICLSNLISAIMQCI